jgi:arylsulfatase A-like enzyme
VIAKLKALGLYDDSLIIVTADHGEAFAERRDRRLGHVVNLHQELVRVPLLIKYPGSQPPEIVTETVSTIDIYPTVLDVLNLEAPTTHELDGVSLRERLPGRAVFFGTNMGRRNKEGVARDQWKLIVNLKTRMVALFDLDADPGERDDLSADRPRIRNELEALRKHFKSRGKSERPPKVEIPVQTPSEIQRLRALGYVD